MNLNALLATGHIALWLLFTGLFFPRLALLFAWLATGDYPPNSLPIIVNIFSWALFPRFLMAYYIYTDVGTANLWFWAYILTGIAGYFGESGFVRRRVIRRTKVIGNREETTTLEE